MDDAVRLPGAVVVQRDQGIQLPTQPGQPLVHRHRTVRDGRRSLGDRRGLVTPLTILALSQQRPHLVRLEQAGQTQIVLLLVGAGERGGAERGPVENHLVQLGVGAE
jgi:hypothetical protein